MVARSWLSLPGGGESGGSPMEPTSAQVPENARFHVSSSLN